MRRVDALAGARSVPEALPLALDNRRRHPAESAAAWQVARAYEGLGAARDEAAAWEAYLRLAPPTGDVCLRLSDVYRSLAQPTQVDRDCQPLPGARRSAGGAARRSGGGLARSRTIDPRRRPH